LADVISHIRLHDVEVSPRTRWLFVEVGTASGMTGLGEASLQGREVMVKEAGDRFAPSLLGMAEPISMSVRGKTLAEAALISAVDQALHDIAAKRDGKRLADYLGGARRERIPLYANINRRTVDRSPSSFAASARLALESGFTAFKLAPFDEVNEAARHAGRIVEAMGPGLDRVAAVARTIDELELMVDCHWRFDETSAKRLIDEARALGVCWVECPVPETLETIPVIRRLREFANDAGMRLAGCEELIGLKHNRPFAEAEAYDVMMPDVKYAGGVREMMRLAGLFERCGVACSPHNPSGPVAHAASLHVSAAMARFDKLEVQFEESDLFWRLVGDSLPRFKDGHSALPDAPGLGITLDMDVLASTSRQAGEWSLTRAIP
jgi:galactonate dehydratase